MLFFIACELVALTRVSYSTQLIFPRFFLPLKINKKHKLILVPSMKTHWEETAYIHSLPFSTLDGSE